MVTTEKKYSVGDQWIIDSEYTEYKNLKKFLVGNNEQEYSYGTSAFHSKQYPLWHDRDLVKKYYDHKDFGDLVSPQGWDQEFDNLIKWSQNKLLEFKIFKKLVPVISWFIEYEVGGWQAMHKHNSNCITQIIYLDPVSHITEDSPAREYAYGSMYAILTNGDETKYMPFVGFPGRSILMTGDIFHGVYPVKSTPRRTIVVDYLYKKDD
jgi:hypothetical protein